MILAWHEQRPRPTRSTPWPSPRCRSTCGCCEKWGQSTCEKKDGGGSTASMAPPSSPSTTGSRTTSTPGPSASTSSTSCSRNSNERSKEMAAATSSGSAKVTLPADEQILIVREFDAPKHLVYKAFTTPELVKRWWSGQRGEVTLAEIDLRVGGAWRYVMVANGGFEGA